MVDHAQGFITDDGVFFKDKENAVLYEARRNLSVKYRSSLWCDDMSYTVWLDTLDAHRDEILAYLEALRNVQNLQQDGSTTETPNKVDRGRVTGDTSLDPDATDQDEDIFDHGHSGDT